ncbi:MAG: anaerobic ribonucleoside-triphosphate reductase activating protein [Candidatus Pacearchaeota archaeon]
MMKIKAIQKTTLIDYPGKIACTIFIHGCNFKCGFCHNPELVIYEKEKDINENEILTFLEKQRKYLEGVCISGGEPLISLNSEFIKKIKSMGYLIKIDTNGSYPDKLSELISKNLVDYIAMDIKSSRENYPKLVNSRVNLNKIEESIKIISSLPDYEFRTTIIEEIHSKEEVEKIIKWVSEFAGKKIKRFVFQGFKKQHKIIDDKFKNYKDTNEEYLYKLKGIAQEYCNEVIIKA